MQACKLRIPATCPAGRGSPWLWEIFLGSEPPESFRPGVGVGVLKCWCRLGAALTLQSARIPPPCHEAEPCSWGDEQSAARAAARGWGGMAGTASNSRGQLHSLSPFCQDLRRPVYMGPPCGLCCLICLLKMMLSGMCAHL